MTAAQAIRAENEKISALLLLPEVCSDGRLVSHYTKRQRDVSPLLAALKSYERTGDEDALAALGREMLLLTVLTAEGGESYAGAGVCVRVRNSKDTRDAASYLSHLASRLPNECAFTVTESAPAFLIAECEGARAYAVLSALPKDAAGEGAAFSVYPILEKAEIREEDVRTDIFLNGGKGGQNVNKVETAVRMTHIPTGVSVTCRDERSQLQNKKRAARLLRERVKQHYLSAQKALIARAKSEC